MFDLKPMLYDDAAQSLAEHLPFPYISVAYIPKFSPTIYTFFTHTIWEGEYTKKLYFRDDPLFHMALQSPGLSIIWSAVPKKTKKAASIMNERVSITSVGCGITRTIDTPDGRFVLAVGDSRTEAEFFEAYNHFLDPLVFWTKGLKEISPC